MIKMPPVRQDYYPLGGGLDLVTPAIAIPPGCVIDSQNYEPAIGGGYRRIDGYERYDGRQPPTGSPYWIVPVSLTGSILIGSTITGLSSGVTGVVLAAFLGYLVCARVTGTFTVGESFGAGTILPGQSTNGATTPRDHADFTLLAANDQRQFILPVPGSGPIRGVWVFNDVVYAFRDNAAGTAGLIFKATSTGWTQITFQTELRFTTATAQISIGEVVTGGTSGATGTVQNALMRTGTWTVGGAGSLILTGVTGTFISGEPIKVGTATRATTAASSTPISRLPGGRLEFFNYNFTGSTNTSRVYGCDGVNTAFEFDGTNYYPIRTGMLIDTPLHIIAHKSYLFLSFLGSVQYSAIGNPYAWTVVLGAGEITCSKPVTGFLPQGGDATGSSLAIFTTERTFILYGTSNADFRLVSSMFDLGYLPYTLQQVSNNAYGMTSRGIQALLSTLNYGDFDYASVSHMIQPLITRKRGLECASTTMRNRNQYRVYFTDGTALSVGLTGDKAAGIMLLNYGRPVRCIVSTTLSNNAEVAFFGSDDGYIYQDNVGTSQDGAPIEAWVRLPFNNDKSPRIRKRYRRAVFEVAVEGFSLVNISYDLGYGNPDVAPSAPEMDTTLAGGGGYWDQFTWDQFTWDAQTVSNPTLAIDGTEKNLGLLFYSSRAQDQSHIVQGVTLIFSLRVLQR